MLPGVAIARAAIWLMMGVSVLSAMVYFRSFWSEAMLKRRQRRTALPFVVRQDGKNVRAN
jgi:hypothetical protein